MLKVQSELDAAQAELSLKDADVADLQYAHGRACARTHMGSPHGPHLR